MKKPHVSSERARAAESRPSSIVWQGNTYEVIPAVEVVRIWDDTETADAMAADFGTYAKHSGPRFPQDGWTSVSIVGLP